MHISTFLATVILAVSPSFAQTLDPRYEQVGAFEGTINDAAVTFTALFDNERDRSMVQLRDASGFATLGVSARSIGEDGTPESPSISFTVGPIMQGMPANVDVFYSDETGYYVSDIDFGGRVPSPDFEYDDGEVQFSIAAELGAVTRNDDGEWEADTDRGPVAVSGTFSGVYTDVD